MGVPENGDDNRDYDAEAAALGTRTTVAGGFSTVEAAVAAGSCRGLYFRLQLHGDHLAIHDWGPGLSSNPYLCFRRLIRGGSRPPDYQETCADIGLGEGEHWSEPLFRESTPARWEEGGAQEPQMGRGGRLTWLQEKDQQLNPKWRPILLKLDRLVSSGTTDEKFLIECWDRPCAPHAGDTGERARVQSQAEAVEESLQEARMSSALSQPHRQIAFVITSVQELLALATDSAHSDGVVGASAGLLAMADCDVRPGEERRQAAHLLMHSENYKDQAPDYLRLVQERWPGVLLVKEARVMESRHLFFNPAQPQAAEGKALGAGGNTLDQRFEELVEKEEEELARLEGELEKAEARVANNLVQFTRREAVCNALRERVAAQQVHSAVAWACPISPLTFVCEDGFMYVCAST